MIDPTPIAAASPLLTAFAVIGGIVASLTLVGIVISAIIGVIKFGRSIEKLVSGQDVQGKAIERLGTLQEQKFDEVQKDQRSQGKLLYEIHGRVCKLEGIREGQESAAE